MRLELDSPVRCADAVYGQLVDLVVDPTQRRITHVVVRPQHQEAAANRLVPIELIDQPASEHELVERHGVQRQARCRRLRRLH